MHSSPFYYTVLLASTVVQDIDCLPLPNLSRLAPHAKNAPAIATHVKNALGAGTGHGRAMSSYHGPMIPEVDREAVAIIDAKNDDHSRYSKVNAIISGVNDKAAAHGSIKDYHSQMTKARWEKEHGPFHEAELKVFAGGENPMQKSAPHEQHFPGKPEPVEHHMSDLSKHFHPETKEVDVFHLAPMYHKDLKNVFDQVGHSNRKIKVAHTTVGYNNNQKPEHLSDGTVEKEHLQSFHKLPHNKDATTVLMQSKTSFGGSAGGTQEYNWVKSRSPPSAMKPITTHEPFHLDQMKHADDIIAKHNEKHKGDKTKQVKVPDPIPGKNDAEKQANMWAGRLKVDEDGKAMSKKMHDHAAQRQEALKKIQEHDKEADRNIPNSLRRLDAVKDGMKNKCEVETCDASHVAVVLDAHMKYPEKFVSVKATSGRDVAPASHGDVVHGVTLLNQSRDHARNVLHASFPPVFDAAKSEKIVGDH